MITNTHFNMGKLIYDYFKNNLDVKLNKTSFLIGNIKPDYFDMDIRLPHTLDESAVKIIEYSKKLIHEDISLKEFSYGLGVICHFLCDYFCTYHRGVFKNKNWLEHYLYELELHYRFTGLFKKNELQLDKNINFYGKDIVSVMNHLNKRYDQEIVSINKDINYALFAAISVSQLIIYQYIISFNYKNDAVDFNELPEVIGSAL